MRTRSASGRVLLKLAGAALVVATASSALAVQPQFWRIDSWRDFLDAEVTGLSIDSAGHISLAPAVRPGPDFTAPYVWSLAADKAGRLYAGTGNDGKIFKIEGRLTQAFYDAAELEVQALAVGPDGKLYAATNPEGRVYAIDQNGKGETFFDPAERYIWALAFDGAGRLLVATGGEGKVYRVDAKGQGAAVLTSPDAHVTALAIGSGGRWFAGSSPSGLVYEVDGRDRVQVLHDSNFREVKALLPGAGGSVYAALVDGRQEAPPRAAPSPSPSPSPADGATPAPGTGVSIDVFAFPSAPPVAPPGPPRAGAGPSRGAIAKIGAFGDVDQIWSGDESPFFLLERNGAVLFGVGARGRIYEARDDRSFTLLRSLDAEQLTAAVVVPGGEVAVASSNPGAIDYLGAQKETTGSLVSAVRDLDNPAQLGAIDADASAGATYEIRTGNSATPDTTWSGWEKVVPGRAPSATPPARFAQLRATITAAAKPLSWVAVAYVQRNQRPLIREVTVYPQGEAFQRSGGGDSEIAGLDPSSAEIKAPSGPTGRSSEGANLGRKVTQRGIRTVTWRAEDVNGDDLVYDVLYRVEGDATFRKLRENLDDPLVAWDTTTVPSGRYVLRVVASDRKANPDGRGLAYEKDTEPFDVDHTPPEIVASQNSPSVRVVVKDAMNIVRRVEWAPEAGLWSELVPADGLSDSREETYEIRLQAPLPPAVVIRAIDAFGNVALQRVPIAR